jgi:hypothetical protein
MVRVESIRRSIVAQRVLVTHARQCASKEAAMVMNSVEDPTPLLQTSWTASDGHRSLRVSGETGHRNRAGAGGTRR